jgi:iron(III) transport system substrate-binding protein
MSTSAKRVEQAETWLRRCMQLAVVAGLVAAAFAPLESHSQEKVLNLYSARHYQTDEALYADFTKQTGIKLNRIELGDEQLVQRLRTEDQQPADVVLLVDAARLWRAQIDGLFQPVQSKLLNDRIPANLRSNDGTWYGFSTRARAIVYNKATVKPEDVDTYEELADPKNKGKVCTRSGSHPYMLSLIGSMVERIGEAKTEDWARGVVANMARPPRGGDTDQIKGVAAGECGVALTNSYYWVRLLRSIDSKDKEVVSKVGFVGRTGGAGTHVNISGGESRRTRRTRPTRSRSSNTCRARRRRLTSRTATTSGPSSKRRSRQSRTRLARDFKAETIRSRRSARIRSSRSASSTALDTAEPSADLRGLGVDKSEH